MLAKGSMMHITRWLSATALVCGIAACGGGSKDYDTARDFFEAFGEVFCEKLDECNQLGNQSVSECEAEFLAETCPTADRCNEPRPDDISNEDVEDCLDDVEDLSCPITMETAVPGSCLALAPPDDGGDGGTLTSA